MTTKKPGRPPLSASGRTSVYVHAPITEVAEWKKAAKRAGRTLNGWLRDAATLMLAHDRLESD